MDRYSFEARSLVIGSSDATKIMGDGDDWLELYREKTDRAFYEKGQARTSAALIVRAGRALEAVNLEVIAEKIRRPIEKPPETGFFDEERPFMVAMPDGVLRDIEYEGVRYSGLSAVEVKACGGWQDAEERFKHYYPQIQHEIYCMNAAGCLFGLMIGTTQHYTAYAGADTVFLEDYLDRADRFVNEHLLPRKPPEPSTIPPARYVIPPELVPVTVDKSDDAVWRMFANALVMERAEAEAAERHKTRMRERIVKAFRELGNVRMVTVDRCRFSLTKAGVLQFRNLDKDGEE